jgi:hypothetical protein
MVGGDRRPGEGTREAKRRRRAAPDAGGSNSAGCQLVLWGYLAVCLLWFLRARAWIAVALGIPALAIAVLTTWAWIDQVSILLEVRRRWAPRGVRGLLVHSNSEAWKDHIAERWIPRIGGRAALFNWSDRATDRGSLEARVFRHFCGETRDFNPAVVVFRGLRRPLVFRFYYAFLEVRAGRPGYLEEQERGMFAALGV